MRFIQNHELREWVKESLRKAIFQKAHALAIQTGCEILVKLQDDSADATANHQYYASKVLRQAYKNNRIRMHAEEKFVSGETGMPVVNQGMQIGGGMGEGLEGLMLGNQAMMEGEFSEQYLANGDAITQTTIHMQMAEENAYVQSAEGLANSQMDHCQTTSTPEEANNKIPGVRIKVEKLDEDVETSCTTSQGVHGDRLSESLPISASTSSLQRSTVSINPKPYQCAVCHKAFRSVQVLQKHTQTFHMRTHGMGSFKSRGKGGHFSSRLPPREQLQDLTMPPGLPPDFKGFYCMMCNQDFPNSTALQDHMMLSHMETHCQADNPSDNSHLSLTEPQSSITDKASVEGAATSTSTNLQNQALFVTPGPGSQHHSQATSPVPMFMKLPSSPSAPFSQSSPSGPIFSHPGFPVGLSRMSGSSGRSKHRTYTKRLMGKQLSNRDIMSAILQTAGPVATHFTVLTASPNFILGSTYITKEQFVAAASALQDLHLGSLVTVRHIHGRPSVNFVKKPPEDAKEFLEVEANADLCTPNLYEEKFKAATPACVPQGTRDKLVSLGLVSRNDFK